MIDIDVEILYVFWGMFILGSSRSEWYNEQWLVEFSLIPLVASPTSLN